jgi:hypothetical protein
MSYDPARYAPGTPWASHDWGTDPLWIDTAAWCVVCGAASFWEEAHKPCSGPTAGRIGPPSGAVLLAPVVPPK